MLAADGTRTREARWHDWPRAAAHPAPRTYGLADGILAAVEYARNIWLWRHRRTGGRAVVDVPLTLACKRKARFPQHPAGSRRGHR